MNTAHNKLGLAALAILAGGMLASPWGCESTPQIGESLSIPSDVQLEATAQEEDPRALGSPGHGGASGQHWGFNIIGHPNNNFSGDNSNGHAIMVPLKTVPGPDEVICNAPGDQTIFTDDQVPTFQTSEPTGAKIYFIAGDHFEIMDRDALDSNGAKIMVPTTTMDPSFGPEITFDIYIRVLGQPNTCMTIDAFAFDQQQNAYFWAGSVALRRQWGQSKFVKVNGLFDVNFCDIADCGNTSQHLSVFNDVFDSYFWNILNNGVRNVQVRLYPRQ